MSTLRNAAVPETFEKVPIDLNAANLRIELKKIRERKRKEVQDVLKVANPDKAKEEFKRDDSFDIPEKLATQEELDEIKHIFVNILLQRSKNPKNAIVSIDVIMVDEDDETDIPDGHFAVAVPIRQHEGVYERNHKIPYVLFKRTRDHLRDDSDLLSLITDVTIISGKSPDIQPPLGFIKIPVDLRQTPGELIEATNLDYVFICYKEDRDLNLYERDLLLYKKFYDLNISIYQVGTPEYDTLTEARKYLNLTFNMELLLDLAQSIRDSLSGPVGKYYWEQNSIEVVSFIDMLIEKYIKPVKLKIDQFLSLKVQKEFSNDFEQKVTDLVYQSNNNFKDILNFSLQQLFEYGGHHMIKNSVAVCLYLSNLLEQEGEYRNAIHILR